MAARPRDRDGSASGWRAAIPHPAPRFMTAAEVVAPAAGLFRIGFILRVVAEASRRQRHRASRGGKLLRFAAMSKRNRPTTAVAAAHRSRRHAYRSAYNSPEGKAARAAAAATAAKTAPKPAAKPSAKPAASPATPPATKPPTQG